MGNARTGPDARLAVLTRGQHGPFSLDQALTAGFSRSAVKRRVDSGCWVRLHRGVYCEAAVPASLQRDAAAAVIACGPGAAASHRTAARWWELDVPPADRLEVTVLLPSRARPASVLVHETTRLSRSEAAPRDGVRITSPMRTLVDLADLLDPGLLELALDRAWRRGLVHPARLLGYLEDDWCRARRGTATLRRMVQERLGQGPAGSDLETMFLQLLRDAGLPLPVRQYPVVTPFGPRYLDLAFADPKLAIELDGMESRLDPEAFLDDRSRQNLIEAQGWTFRRFGYAHVTEHSLWTVFTVGDALGRWPVKWVSKRP